MSSGKRVALYLLFALVVMAIAGLSNTSTTTNRLLVAALILVPTAYALLRRRSQSRAVPIKAQPSEAGD